MAEGAVHHTQPVQRLVSGHGLLLEACHGLKRSADDDYLAAFRAAPARFKSLRVPHVAQEAYRGCTSLHQTLKARGAGYAHQRVNGSKAEAGHLGEVAIEFIDTYMPNLN